MRHYRFDGQELLPVVAHGGMGHVLTKRVEETGRLGAANFIDLTIVPAESAIGHHRHTEDNEEIYIIVSGKGRMTLDGRTFEVGPGDVIVNSAGGAHGLENTAPEDMRIVVIEVPKNGLGTRTESQ
jgi:mannose-6-phosphate isomerase-like protein (cupin superfamily)